MIEVNAIADILLVGDWQPKAMIKRIFWLLEAEPFWVVYLVEAVFGSESFICPQFAICHII